MCPVCFVTYVSGLYLHVAVPVPVRVRYRSAPVDTFPCDVRVPVR
jgi:hypothetical protein